MSDPEEIIDELIFDGGLEFAGRDPETGEPLYRPTTILKHLDPKLSDDIANYFSETTLELWQRGFIDMDVMLEDPLVKLADKAFDLKAVDSLEKNQKIILQEIIRVLSEKN